MATITVSGKSYDACLDPAVSAGADENGWPAPTMRRRGKGWQAEYPAEHAASIAAHLRAFAEAIAWSDDPDARAEGRAAKRDADRIAAACGSVA